MYEPSPSHKTGIWKLKSVKSARRVSLFLSITYLGVSDPPVCALLWGLENGCIFAPWNQESGGKETGDKTIPTTKHIGANQTFVLSTYLLNYLTPKKENNETYNSHDGRSRHPHSWLHSHPCCKMAAAEIISRRTRP